MPPPANLAAIAQSGWGALCRFAELKPSQANVTIGLDIGSSVVKAVAIGPPRRHRPPALLGRARIASDGSEASIAEAVHQAISALQVPSKTVNVSVSGQWVIMRVVEMPSLKPDEFQRALSFEAQRHLPFNLDEVVLDGAILGPAEAGKMWALLVACKRELLERRVALVKHAGLEPAVIDVDAVALANVFAHQVRQAQAPSRTTAWLNLGAQWTNLLVLKGDVPYLVRDIPWGSAKLARELAEQVGRPEADVAAALSSGAALPAEWTPALKGAVQSLGSDLQLSFDFFESRFGTPPDQIILSGGAIRSSTLLEKLTAEFLQPVMCWSLGDDLSSEFAVAYGLALRTG